MTKEEILFFEALHNDRNDSATTLEKPSMKGVYDSVIDKYTDQAHFTYELLQNADDARAKFVKFILEKDKLIFLHNGTIHFSISNPNTEKEDAEKEKLGHLNAITSIGNSPKGKKEAKIGKFGVGFKAIFQYTNTPHIYDPNIAFKIERFIVPILLDHDFSNRKNDETVFVFPFDNKQKDAKSACEEIAFKLDSLVYPILFLNNLETVNYETENHSGSYSKKTKQSRIENDITCEYIELSKSLDNEIEKQNLWLFSKFIDKNKISVGFFVDENGKIIEAKQTAFCFFPTTVNTNLSFIINAPFLLTDSREGIKAGSKHNKIMIQSLAELAATSLELLKMISIEQQVVLFGDDNFTKIIPYDSSLYISHDERTQISFLPFYEEIRNRLLTSELIPSGKFIFSSKNNSYWASYSNIPELFSNKQLRLLVNNNEANWILPTISRDEISRTNKDLCSYIEDIIDYPYDDSKIIAHIDEAFIEVQSIDWLYKFYGFINSSDKRKNLVKDKPIFLNRQKKATPAFDRSGHPILFITDNETPDYDSILPELLLDAKTKELIDFYGIRRPELKDEVYNKILPKYNNLDDDKEAFKKIFKYYKKCPQDEISIIENKLKELLFKGTIKKEKVKELYLKTDLLYEYFINQPNYIDIDYYKTCIETDDYDLLNQLFEKIGINILPKKSKREVGRFFHSEVSKKKMFDPDSRSGANNVYTYTEYSFEGLHELLQYVISKNDKKKSVCLWKILNSLCGRDYNRQYHLCKGYEFIIGKCEYYFHGKKSVAYDTDINKLLFEGNWLIDKTGNFKSPHTLYREELSECYTSDNNDYSLLFDFLKIKQKPEINKEVENDLTDEQKRKIEFADRLESLGITEEEIKELLKQRPQNNSNHYSDPGQTYEHCSVIDVYNKWKCLTKEEWNIKKKEYYNRIFPTTLMNEEQRNKDFNITEDYFALENYNISHPTIPKTWCILFMLGTLQSSNYWGESRSELARKNKIEALMNFITAFSNGDSLESIYNKYLDTHETNEDDLEEFENLLRVYKFRRKFMEIWTEFYTIKSEKYVDLNDLVNASASAKATGKGLGTYSSQKSLKYGISIIIRELLDNGFFGNNKQDQEKAFNLLNKFTYMPHAYLRRIVFSDWKETPDEKSSEDIHNEIKKQLQAENISEEQIRAFMKCHDLPFLILGEKK